MKEDGGKIYLALQFGGNFTKRAEVRYNMAIIARGKFVVRSWTLEQLCFCWVVTIFAVWQQSAWQWPSVKVFHALTFPPKIIGCWSLQAGQSKVDICFVVTTPIELLYTSHYRNYAFLLRSRLSGHYGHLLRNGTHVTKERSTCHVCWKRKCLYTVYFLSPKTLMFLRTQFLAIN